MSQTLLAHPESLARPVEFGDVRLAPTVELVGLAELALANDDATRLATIQRVARAISVEDAERIRMRKLRRAAERNELGALPHRR